MFSLKNLNICYLMLVIMICLTPVQAEETQDNDAQSATATETSDRSGANSAGAEQAPASQEAATAETSKADKKSTTKTASSATEETNKEKQTIVKTSVITSEFTDDKDREESHELDKELQTLKQDILQTNRDLFILEEDLLFPSNTQIKVFLSIDADNYFDLDSVTLKVDNKPVAYHLYTERENRALKRGAVQRLHTANISTGAHELVAVVLGYGPKGREYKRAASYEFEKGSGAKFIHFEIAADEKTQQPDFNFKEWD